MAYVGELRRKGIVTITQAIKDEGYFKEVYDRQPAWQVPKATDLPACYVALASENPEWKTNEERMADLLLAVFPMVWSDIDEPAQYLDLVKCDAVDRVEQALFKLYLDSDFRADFHRIDVDLIDYGPLALESFGIPLLLAPPFGGARLDVRLKFYYDAI